MLRRLCLLLALLAGGVWAAEPGPTLDEEHALRTDFVTPHTAWAKPWALGTTRVLFFSDTAHCQAREVIELMQRFDVSAEAVYYGTIVDTTIRQWHGGEEGLARARRLIEGTWDVAWFNGLEPAKLPAELQFKLLKRVTEGAGLVLVGVNDPRVLKHPLPAEANGPQADLFGVVKGRAARLPATPTVPYRFGWEVEYDLWQARLGRTILWAANKLPPAGLAQRAMAALQGGNQGAGRVAPQEAPNGSTVRYRTIDGATEIAPPLGEELLGGRPAGTDIAPALRDAEARGHLRGWAYQDVIIRQNGKVVDWCSRRLERKPYCELKVELDRTWGEVGEALSGRVRLVGQAVPGETVAVELHDRRGRILAAQAATAPTDRVVPFRFDMPEYRPMLVRVLAIARAGGQRSEGDAYYNVCKRHRGQFNFLVWDVPGGPTGPFAEEQLARLGMSLQLANFGGGVPPQIAANDVSVVPYTTRIMDDKDANGHLKPVPWNQEPQASEYVHQTTAPYAKARQHGVFVYSLGDETVTRGSDLSPSDLTAYQRWLQGVYGTIAKLNAAWGTTFRDWTEVVLSDPKDPRELQSKRDGHFARWYDRQAWECANFLGFCKRFGADYAKLDPQARTGFEGAGTFHDGDDFDGIVRTNTFWSPYPGPADLVLRDIAPRDFPRANWMGYTKDADTLSAVYWRMVLNGTDAVWWWRWDGVGRFNGILMPNLSPYPAFEELWRETRITREGLGDLLLRSTMQHDGIAMLYSHPSAYATQVANGPSYGNYEQAHASWHDTLAHLGLNFRYFTDGMLRRGEVDFQGLKVLLLPRAEALGQVEAEAIRQFVAQGGTVIADLRPGRYDARCQPRTAGALDDLFGVDSSGSKASVPSAQIASRTSATTWQVTSAVDPGLKATTAAPQAAAGEVPAVSVRQVGAGRAVLLNFAMTRPADQHTGAATLLQSLLAQAGSKPALRVTRLEGGLPQCRAIRWQNGTTQLVIVQNNGAAGRFEVRFGRPYHVRDLKTGTDLGQTASATVDLRHGHAAVLALLGEGTAAVRAEVVGHALQLSLPRAAGGAHAGLVTLTRPDGRRADWLRQVVVVEPGQTLSVPLAFALNDPPGRWQIGFRDVLTQQQTRLPVSFSGIVGVRGVGNVNF